MGDVNPLLETGTICSITHDIVIFVLHSDCQTHAIISKGSVQYSELAFCEGLRLFDNP